MESRDKTCWGPASQLDKEEVGKQRNRYVDYVNELKGSTWINRTRLISVKKKKKLARNKP